MKMFILISKLHDIADKLSSLEENEFSNIIDKVSSCILRSYKFRIERQKRVRGETKRRRKKYYRLNKRDIKRKQKIYRMRTQAPRKLRKKLKHYKRIGKIEQL